MLLLVTNIYKTIKMLVEVQKILVPIHVVQQKMTLFIEHTYTLYGLYIKIKMLF